MANHIHVSEYTIRLTYIVDTMRFFSEDSHSQVTHDYIRINWLNLHNDSDELVRMEETEDQSSAICARLPSLSRQLKAKCHVTATAIRQSGVSVLLDSMLAALSYNTCNMRKFKVEEDSWRSENQRNPDVGSRAKGGKMKKPPVMESFQWQERKRSPRLHLL